MSQPIDDLRSEADDLNAFLRGLGHHDWHCPTPFKGWTTWDVIAHLYYFDLASIMAMENRDEFEQRRPAVERAQSSGVMASLVRQVLGEIEPAELLARWHTNCHSLADRLEAAEPKRRLPWFGPEMGLRMFATARLMETWAHGQDVYDLVRVRRPLSDRIKHIALIGVRTFQWTFQVRGLEIPGPDPYVRLVAPSGATWEWNDPVNVNRIEGLAVDFCRVVSQCRNVADTDLFVAGPSAERWMSLAQCFAGLPSDPPRPGERAWEREGA